MTMGNDKTEAAVWAWFRRATGAESNDEMFDRWCLLAGIQKPRR